VGKVYTPRPLPPPPPGPLRFTRPSPPEPTLTAAELARAQIVERERVMRGLGFEPWTRELLALAAAGDDRALAVQGWRAKGRDGAEPLLPGERGYDIYAAAHAAPVETDLEHARRVRQGERDAQAQAALLHLGRAEYDARWKKGAAMAESIEAHVEDAPALVARQRVKLATDLKMIVTEEGRLSYGAPGDWEDLGLLVDGDKPSAIRRRGLQDRLDFLAAEVVRLSAEAEAIADEAGAIRLDSEENVRRWQALSAKVVEHRANAARTRLGVATVEAELVEVAAAQAAWIAALNGNGHSHNGDAAKTGRRARTRT
jgi:hypothetical protein